MHNIGSEYDSHTRVSYKDNPGFFGQIQQSFGATLIGILLVVISFPVIYWNEVRVMTQCFHLHIVPWYSSVRNGFVQLLSVEWLHVSS